MSHNRVKNSPRLSRITFFMRLPMNSKHNNRTRLNKLGNIVLRKDVKNDSLNLFICLHYLSMFISCCDCHLKHFRSIQQLVNPFYFHNDIFPCETNKQNVLVFNPWRIGSWKRALNGARPDYQFAVECGDWRGRKFHPRNWVIWKIKIKVILESIWKCKYDNKCLLSGHIILNNGSYKWSI